tara:strand:+ start:192 stop:545 length:354 start_codon:yes stop_codon:yes gene_type:complete
MNCNIETLVPETFKHKCKKKEKIFKIDYVCIRLDWEDTRYLMPVLNKEFNPDYGEELLFKVNYHKLLSKRVKFIKKILHEIIVLNDLPDVFNDIIYKFIGLETSYDLFKNDKTIKLY